MKYLLTALLLLTTCAVAKDRQWQDGQLLEMRVQLGQKTTQTIGSVVINNDTYTYNVVVDAGAQIITGAVVQSKTWGYKKPQLIENASVKFVVEKDKLILLDSANRELKTEIVARRAKD